MRHNVIICFRVLILLVFICSVSLAEGSSAEHQKGRENAKASIEPENSPKIQFDELSHDFGKAIQNSTLKHTFTFKNVGKGVLHIEKVKAG